MSGSVILLATGYSTPPDTTYTTLNISVFEHRQCNAKTNVLGLYCFVLYFPEDGTPVPKHVGALLSLIVFY